VVGERRRRHVRERLLERYDDQLVLRLRFDPAIEALVPGGSSLVFQRVDCADGRQGPVEEGVDCGWVCRIGCP